MNSVAADKNGGNGLSVEDLLPLRLPPLIGQLVLADGGSARPSCVLLAMIHEQAKNRPRNLRPAQ